METRGQEDEGVALTQVIYVCDLCQMPFGRQDLMPTHLDREHDQVTSPENPMYHVVKMKDVITRLKGFRKRFTCRLCQEEFKSKERIAAHICISKEQGTLSCVSVCPQGHRLSKWQGQVVFSERKVWLCHICGGHFPDRHQLRKHVKDRCSNAEKKYHCQREGCTFSTNYGCHMRRHLNSRHLSPDCPRPYVCDQCGMGFLHSYRLLCHKMDTHSRERTYQCKFCPKVFYSRNTQKRHEYIHKNQAAFLCGHCGQSFSNKFNLRVHENIHTGQKPYKCHLCEAAFAQKNSLNVHSKKHRKEELMGQGIKGGGGGGGGGGGVAAKRGDASTGSLSGRRPAASDVGGGGGDGGGTAGGGSTDINFHAHPKESVRETSPQETLVVVEGVGGAGLEGGGGDSITFTPPAAVPSRNPTYPPSFTTYPPNLYY